MIFIGNGYFNIDILCFFIYANIVCIYRIAFTRKL